MTLDCPLCRNQYDYRNERCPHCAHPGNYANVIIAGTPSERDAVEARFLAALDAASGRGCRAEFEAFTAWSERAQAVLARPLEDVQRLAAGPSTVYATYYDLTDSGLTLPDGSRWEALRRPADEVLFPTYRERIRFGALAVDGVGVRNYGLFWLTMRTALIEHRTSIFDQNSVKFVVDIPISQAIVRLTGHRAVWVDKGKLAAAQLGHEIASGYGPEDFKAILLRQGATTDDDRYIETNIFGSVTVLTVERVCYSRSMGKPTPKSIVNDLRRKLHKFSVSLDELP
jgi:hypothetical protein